MSLHDYALAAYVLLILGFLGILELLAILLLGDALNWFYRWVRAQLRRS